MPVLRQTATPNVCLLGHRPVEQLGNDRRVGHDRIGQGFVPAPVAVAESIVIQAELVEDRGVPVCDADPVLDRLVANFVGRSVDIATLESTAGKPEGEGVAVMVAAGSALGDRQPPELAGKQHVRALVAWRWCLDMRQERNWLTTR